MQKSVGRVEWVGTSVGVTDGLGGVKEQVIVRTPPSQVLHLLPTVSHCGVGGGDLLGFAGQKAQYLGRPRQFSLSAEHPGGQMFHTPGGVWWLHCVVCIKTNNIYRSCKKKTFKLELGIVTDF